MAFGNDLEIGVEINASGGNFDKRMSALQARLKKVSAGLRSVGRSLTVGVTLPLLAVGARAVFVADQFKQVEQTIRASTGAVGTELKALSADVRGLFRSLPEDLQVIAKTFSTLRTLTGGSGDALRDLTRDVLNASRVLREDGSANAELFGKTLQQWQIPLANSRQLLNALFRITQKNAIPLSKLLGLVREYGAVLKNAGFNIIEVAELQARLNKAGIDWTRISPGINAAFRKWAGEGRNLRSTLIQVVGEIESAQNSTRALAIATDAFGAEGAARLTTAIREGSFSFDNLNESMSASTSLIGDTAKETQTFSERLQLFKNRMDSAIAPIGNLLIPFLNRGINLLDRSTQAWERLSKETKSWAVILAVAVGALGPLLIGLGIALSFISPWALLAVAIGSVGLAVALVARNWETIGPQLGRIWQAILNDLRDRFNNFNNDLIELGRIIRSNVQDILGGDLWDTVGRVWSIGVAGLITIGKRLSEKFEEILPQIRQSIATDLPSILDSAREKIGGFFSFLGSVPGKIQSAVKGGVDFFKEAFSGQESATFSVEGSGLSKLADSSSTLKVDLLGVTTSLQTMSSIIGPLDEKMLGLSKSIAIGTKGLNLQIEQYKLIREIAEPALQVLATEIDRFTVAILEQAAAIPELGNSLDQLVRNMSQAIEQEISSSVNTIIGEVQRLHDKVLGLMEKLDQELIGGSVVPDMMDGIVAEFGRMNTEVVPLVRTATSATQAEFIEAADPIGSVGEEMERLKSVIRDTNDFKALNELINEMKGLMQSATDQTKQFGEAAKTVPEQLRTIFETQTQQAQQSLSFVDVLLQGFKFNALTVFEEIRTAGIFTWGSIRTALTNSIVGMLQDTTTFSEFLQSIWTTILAAIVNTIITIGVQWAIGQLFQQQQSTETLGVLTAVEAAKTAIFGAAETARLGIATLTNKAMLGAIISTLGGMTALGTAAVAIFSAVGLLIVAVLTAVATGLSSNIFTAALAPAVFTAAAEVGIAVGLAAGLAAASIQVAAGTAIVAASTSLSSPVGFAEGGIVTGPTLGFFEGNQKEAVIPLSRFDEVAGNRGGGRQVIILEVDSRTMARAVLEGMPKEVRMKVGAIL